MGTAAAAYPEGRGYCPPFERARMEFSEGMRIKQMLMVSM